MVLNVTDCTKATQGGMKEKCDRRHWLTLERLTIYPIALFGSEVLAALIFFILYPHLQNVDPGLPFSSDFRVFWGASYLALHGYAADAYNIEKLFDALRLADPALIRPRAWFNWFYPPTFLLAVLPLALLPYLMSYALFVLGTLAGYLALLRRIVPMAGSTLVVIALAFPPTILTAFNGQNAFLTATLAGLGLMLLERRPVLAGVCIGLLSIKPHLAVLFPLALVCSRSWKALLAAGLTALGLTVLSVAVLGMRTIPAFLEGIHLARTLASAGELPLAKMPTVYGALRLLGLSTDVANGLHILVALVAALVVVAVWRKPLPLYLRASVLVTSSLLISPHMYDYDLTWLALPMAWLANQGIQNGWRRGERELLLGAWISPMVTVALANGFSLQLEPLVILLMLIALLRRAHIPKRSFSG